MKLRLENVRFGREHVYSVVCKDADCDRLIIQTTNHNLAKLVLMNGYSDGSQIPKELMEKSAQKVVPAGTNNI